MSSKHIAHVVANFEAILPTVERHLGSYNLSMTTTVVDHLCRTPACHAGWYSVATPIAKVHPVDALSFPCERDTFMRGVYLLNYDLGFPQILIGTAWNNGLLMWAAKHQGLWGNEYGHLMFSASGARAFMDEEHPYPAHTLRDIIDHWKRVLVRVQARERAEAQVEISNPPITAEQLVESLSPQPEVV